MSKRVELRSYWVRIDAHYVAKHPLSLMTTCWARGVWGLIHLEHDDFDYDANAVVWC